MRRIESSAHGLRRKQCHVGRDRGPCCRTVASGMRSPETRRSILLVAHGAPPSPLAGARRIAGLSRYLAELGHEVTVLTSIMFGRGPGQWGAARIVRTRDAMASPVLEQRRRWK